MKCMYESSHNPSYDRIEQHKQSHIKLLERLCRDAELSLKSTDKLLVIFGQSKFEKKAPVRTIQKGRDYLSYSLRTSTAGRPICVLSGELFQPADRQKD